MTQPTTPEAAKLAINAIVIAASATARAYWIDHCRPPRRIVVLAQPRLYSMLSMRLGLTPDVFGQLDLITGELHNIGLNAPITVVHHHTPDAPMLGYTIVVGNSDTDQIRLEAYDDHHPRS